MRDCAPAEAGVDQLTPAHHAVLAGGKTGDMGIGSERVELFIHHINKSPRGTDSPLQYTGRVELFMPDVNRSTRRPGQVVFARRGVSPAGPNRPHL